MPSDFFAPQPLARLAFIRFAAPLAILGFLMARLIHPGDWLSSEGFRVPYLEGKDYRQPLYFPPLPLWAAWTMSVALVASGLAVSAGWKTRVSSGVFALLLIYVAFADRLSAFSVNKLGVVIALALCLSPSGAAYSLDAWAKSRSSAGPAPTLTTWGNVRFFQGLLVVMYCFNGVAKIQGDWLKHPYVLWTHLHDSYQTLAAYYSGLLMPVWAWTLFQALTLLFETGAPLWFAWKRALMPALIFGLGMHLVIGLYFGPVKWFALLMMALLLGSFAPIAWIQPLLEKVFLRNRRNTMQFEAVPTS